MSRPIHFVDWWRLNVFRRHGDRRVWLSGVALDNFKTAGVAGQVVLEAVLAASQLEHAGQISGRRHDGPPFFALPSKSIGRQERFGER